MCCGVTLSRFILRNRHTPIFFENERRVTNLFKGDCDSSQDSAFLLFFHLLSSGIISSIICVESCM